MKTLHATLLLITVVLANLADVTDGALPGGRYGTAVWNIPGSTIYLYGGQGIGAQSGQQGRLNDMWSYDYISNSWKLLSGDSQQTDVAPLFGDKGVSSATNTPGGLQFPCTFYNNSILWLFGGSTQDAYTNAMWQYSIASNEWMWISGSQTPNANGVYTDFKSFSVTAFAGGREGATCYTDSTNNIFGMFGGRGIGETDGVEGLLNDMWHYSVDSGRWGWMSGDTAVNKTITPGPKLEPSTDIYPSGTAYAGPWIFQNVNATSLYFAFGSVATSDYSDQLWVYGVQIDQWVYINGNEDWTKAVSNRTGAAVWGGFAYTAHSWIFGGKGFDDQGNEGYLGDLHFFDGSNNGYTLFGDASPQAFERNGVYGTKGVPSSANYPGSRAHAATWVDAGGNLWMFGGQGFDSVNRTAGLLNDVWKYNVVANQWTWISGSQYINTPGDYGPKAPVKSTEAPVLTPSGELTADQQIGIGVGVGVGVPFVVGAIILAVLLQKRKADKKKAKKTAETEAINTAENGKYNFSLPAGVNTNYGKIDVALDPPPIADARIGGSDNRLIPYSSVTLEKEIGVGSYGKVYLGKLRTTKVAVKVANTNTKISQDEFIREANFQLAIPPHPNIVQLLGISIDGPEPLVVLEYCNEGSLDKLLFESQRNWTTAEQINLAAAIARGLDHLHQNNIVHRDLAVRNILLHHGEPKISDFGMSRKLKEISQVGKTATNIGPIRWMAPEALGKQLYSTKSDVWTFGLLLYEIVAREEPHQHDDVLSVALSIRDVGYTPDIPANCPEVLRDIMRMCWKLDPAERPDMSIICEKLEIK